MPASETDLDTFIENIEIIPTTSNPTMEKCTGAIRKNLSQPSALIPYKPADHLPSNFKPTVDMINKGFRVCVIMRGLPGKYFDKNYVGLNVDANPLLIHFVTFQVAENHFLLIKSSKRLSRMRRIETITFYQLTNILWYEAGTCSNQINSQTLINLVRHSSRNAPVKE